MAFGFGEPWKLKPNYEISALALALARRTRGRIFTDRDVAPHLLDLSLHVETDSIERVPTTYCLAVMAIYKARYLEVTELCVVTAPCHMWRCLRDLRCKARRAQNKLTAGVLGYQRFFFF